MAMPDITSFYQDMQRLTTACETEPTSRRPTGAGGAAETRSELANCVAWEPQIRGHPL